MKRLIASLSLSLLVLSTSADARDKTIVSIEAKSLVVRDGRDLSRDLRDAVTRELEGLDMTKAPKDARYVLSASLTKLETRQSGDKTASRAKVSLMLKDAKRGALYAVIEGAATAEGTKASDERSEQEALLGAVKGAMTSVPKAVADAK